MADYSTQISTEFTGETYTPAATSLTLEQVPFPVGSGEVLSMVEIAEANGLEYIPAVDDQVISSDINQIYELYYAQCGQTEEGSVKATINVFKSPASLSYNLVASNGTFGSPSTTSINKIETLKFRLDTYKELSSSVESIISVAWEGECYDANGNVVYPGTPILNGNSLVVPNAVYGSCLVNYKSFGDTYILTVPKRNDDEQLQSTVMAFYGDGKVETLDVTFPTLSGSCTDTVSVCVNEDCEQPTDGDGEGSADGDGTSVALQLNAYDYCSGSAISGATYWIGGKQVPETGHTVKRGVTYTIITKASGYKDFTNSFSV